MEREGAVMMGKEGLAMKRSKPRWWQLYVGLPLLAGLYVPEIRLGLTGFANILAQLAILGLIFGFVGVWMRANRHALTSMDDVSGQWSIRLYQIPPAEIPPSTSAPIERLLRLPAPGAEIKGVLSTTFQLDEFEEETVLREGSEILCYEEVLSTKKAK